MAWIRMSSHDDDANESCCIDSVLLIESCLPCWGGCGSSILCLAASVSSIYIRDSSPSWRTRPMPKFSSVQE